MTITAPAQPAAALEQTSCAANAALFQHPLLEDPPASSQLSAEDRRLQKALTARAEAVCSECPLMTACLYEAVVNHDVAGYVAGTTQRQRMQMRAKLGIRVEAEDLDTMAGCFGRNRQVDHEEVVRLRNANPTESLEQIAQRLGCSLSTVKRHLRRARNEQNPKLSVVKPSLEQVLDAFVAVTRPASAQRNPRRAA